MDKSSSDYLKERPWQKGASSGRRDHRTPREWDALFDLGLDEEGDTTFMREEHAAGNTLVGTKNSDDGTIYYFYPDGRIEPIS